MKNINLEKILSQISEEIHPFFGKGKVADYIPALASVDPKKFGMAITTVHGDEFVIGDADEPFSIQSISKVFMLTLAMQKYGEKLWERLGREPSGNRFNSLVQLEYEHGRPRNPFINAGALVVTDAVMDETDNALEELLRFVRTLANRQEIDIDMNVAESEREHGYRNAALANFLKSYNNLHNNPDDVLSVYFQQCALRMSCRDLSRSFLHLAHGGVSPITKEQVVHYRVAKRINAIMQTCGLYNSVGDFAYLVGLPGKSGVGGGIVAVMPGELSVAVWSPELNESGNSVCGMKALELFTTYTQRSIF